MALEDVQIPALEDLVGGLFGEDRFSQLFKQDESDFKQYSDKPTDRRVWSGVKDKSSPEYFFLLKYGPKTLQIPFNVNPQREIISHPHAMTISYAQGGGKIVQSEGMTTKDITIQGTCGLYPGNRLSVAPTSGIGSGLEQIKFLETLFARYCFLKRYGDAAKALQLIYVNRRLQDAWVVEPKNFMREDSAEKNNSFSYTIVLETVYPYNGADAKSLVEQLLGKVPYDAFNTIDTIAQRGAEAVDNLNSVIGEVSAVVDGFVNLVMSPLTDLATAYANLVTGNLPNLASFKRDATKSLIRNLVLTANALEAAGANRKLVGAIIDAENFCKASLLQDKLYQPAAKTNAASTANKQKSQAKAYEDADGSAVSPDQAEAVGAALAQPSPLELLSGGITEQVATAISQGNLPTTLIGSTVQGSKALQKISQSQAAIDQLKKTDPTLAASLKTALDAQNKAKAKITVGAVVSSGSNMSVSSPTSDSPASVAPGESPVALTGGLSKYSATPPTLRQRQSQAAWLASLDADLAAIDPANCDYKTATVNDGDDIQTLALRLLGDAGKWPQIAMLNDLRYPYVASQAYITANGLSNVAPWLSKIIYPAAKAVGQQPSRVWRNETPESVVLQPFERALGSDIMIDAKTGNVVWGANDLLIAIGKSNLEQFIRKRVTVRKGKLRRAPSVGFSNFIGFSDGISFDVITAEAQGLFLDDDRIVATDVGQVTQLAQNLVIVMRCSVRDIQDPIFVEVPA